MVTMKTLRLTVGVTGPTAESLRCYDGTVARDSTCGGGWVVVVGGGGIIKVNRPSGVGPQGDLEAWSIAAKRWRAWRGRPAIPGTPA